MFKRRSLQKELMDDSLLANKELTRNLYELELTNRWFGSRATLISALNKIVNKSNVNKLSIVDLGCGNGDLLRIMAAWAESKRIIVDLHGLDINPFMIEQAQAQSKTSPGIHYKAIDVFSTEFSTLHFDIITMNSFCHHLNNSEMIKALVQLSRQARVAIIINDLQRHRISYYAIKWLAKCLNFSKLAQHDGPLSVLRAFRKQELVNILKQANIHHYSISWRLLFRWQVIVWL